jgi:hypothetical protein
MLKNLTKLTKLTKLNINYGGSRSCFMDVSVNTSRGYSETLVPDPSHDGIGSQPLAYLIRLLLLADVALRTEQSKLSQLKELLSGDELTDDKRSKVFVQPNIDSVVVGVEKVRHS